MSGAAILCAFMAYYGDTDEFKKDNFCLNNKSYLPTDLSYSMTYTEIAK